MRGCVRTVGAQPRVRSAAAHREDLVFASDNQHGTAKPSFVVQNRLRSLKSAVTGSSILCDNTKKAVSFVGDSSRDRLKSHLSIYHRVARTVHDTHGAMSQFA